MRTNRVFIQSIYKEHRVGISHHLLHLEETPLSPCISNLYGQYIMRNARLDEAQAGFKIAARISITSDMEMTPPLWQKAKRN